MLTRGYALNVYFYDISNNILTESGFLLAFFYAMILKLTNLRHD